MTHTRRSFLTQTSAAVGLITVLPFAARADGHMSDVFADGAIKVHPIAHASFVMETPTGVFYVDPVGDPAIYSDMPQADYILVTHEHGDHFNVDTLTALKGEATQMITNPAVFDKLPDALKVGTQALSNGETAMWGDITIDAIAAHNTTEDRMNFHPVGRDNGYVVTVAGFRTYISGDTEPTSEMLALKDIDLAFLCMNLPFTQTAEQAAEAVKVFQPRYVYPYHYHGRDGGTQDPQMFASLVGEASDVKMGAWY
ncbi:MBL fold metallo-hydrolase [Pacificibacter marinus]|uniref:Metal-dependent hydrolase n=1 Tax=Pacificibacter marinus TaxID=658057 RepID=A0A1Y5S9Q4_9RHOB|nr:MBL fold metallo-hydrolase [Pacificibacter marinus]SEK79952.1 L-ascorbate metabolism protein UlaG, beta-lactamase superfamily [Pacificibacter marinus]SLN32845.1 metal-dependent hydrolase [Pacificibacter marinus]